MTRNQTITKDWTQITDGISDAVIQFYVPVDICDSPEKPAAGAPSLRFDHSTLTITAPVKAWLRTVYSDSATVVIL